MLGWFKVTLANTEEVTALVLEARQTIAAGNVLAYGIGIFRAREDHALYYSPLATKLIDPGSLINFKECARPEQIRVKPAVGAYDDPQEYDVQQLTAVDGETYVDRLGNLGGKCEADDLDGLLRAAGF